MLSLSSKKKIFVSPGGRGYIALRDANVATIPIRRIRNVVFYVVSVYSDGLGLWLYV